jgi:hypothetical protein
MLYEVKVQLKEIKPPIWRIIRLRPQTRLARFHRILQTAMGWTNSHLHLFEIDGKLWGGYDPEWDIEVFDYQDVKLKDIFNQGIKSFWYDYDMGDNWRHEITLLGTVENAPGENIACVAGKRACPPEDCGGTYGYYDLLEALADPGHEEHESLLEWVGGEFNPKAFDLEAVDRALKRLR